MQLYKNFNEWLKSYRSDSPKLEDPVSKEAINEVLERIQFLDDNIEDENLELKESIWFDTRVHENDCSNNTEKSPEHYRNSKLEHTKIKTICGFLNSSESGYCYLVIGLKDDGEIVGLERDKTIKNDFDKLELDFKNLLKKYFRRKWRGS